MRYCLLAALFVLTACSSLSNTSGNDHILPSALRMSTTSAPYTYHGCPLYTANDWFTTNLSSGGSSYVPNSIDSRSATIIANLNAAWSNANFNGSSSTYYDEIVNLSNAGTPVMAVQGTTIKNDPYNDDSTNRIPWLSTFRSEGTAGCKYDCHSITLNTQTCVDYETYRYASASYSNGTFTASNGYVHNLYYPLNSQYSTDGGAVSATGLPILGQTDFGEDASLTSINHIVGLIAPGSSGNTRGFSGYVAPATNKEHCAYYCTNGLPYGARLRLKSSYPCPSVVTNPQANLVCNQLKNYGGMLADTLGYGNNWALRFGVSASGSNPWRSTDLAALLNQLRITDFDVMRLGTIR